jgi:hypothetical protein
LVWARYFGSPNNLLRALQDFTSAMARSGRLARAREPNDAQPVPALWTASPDDANRACGFHAGEGFQGTRFRWSQEVAVIELSLPPGKHRVRVETLLTKLTTTSQTPSFYFNGRRIKNEKVLCADGHFAFELKQREGEKALLAWVSGRQPAPGDPRHLGLPVTGLSLLPGKKAFTNHPTLNAATI